MKITHKITMDLDRYSVPGFDAVCGDRYTRELEIALYAGGNAWEIPAETSVTVRYRKPDGTTGAYDLLPDGSAAWSISGNMVTLTLAPQTLTVPGCVILTVCLTAGDREISTFQILMNVQPAVGIEVSDSGDYWYLSAGLPQPKEAAVGEALVVEAVDDMGRVTALKTTAEVGVTVAQVDALEKLLKLVVYAEDPAEAFAAFRDAFGTAVPATAVAVSPEIVQITAGNAKQLTATLTPENSTDVVVWESSDTAVATVDAGRVWPVGNGNCIVTATAGAVSDYCAVIVSGFEEQTHAHSYASAVTTAATCTEAGVRTYTCACGDSYTEEIPAAGHDYVDGICSICGTEETSTTEAFYDVEWIQKPGYYKAGVMTQFSGVYNTGLLAVGDATQWYFKWGRGANYYVAYFDRDLVYLSQTSGWWTAGEKTIEFPEGAAYFAPAYYLEDIDNVEIKVNTNQVRHTIDNSLVSDDLAITNVIHGSAYTAALTSAATTVTMGGEDITATAYADGVVTIEAVTGDVVIA